MDIGSTFGEKAGPLPVWGWMAVIGGLGLVYYVYEKKKGGGGSASSSTAEQQLLAAEEASAANAAQATAVQTPNYNYGRRSWRPAASTTAPVPTTATTPPPAAVGTTSPAPAPAPAPAPVTTAPAPVPTAQVPIFNATYKVQVGETLDSLSAKFGISRVDLAHANGLGTGAGLRTGQTLKVPSPAPAGRPNPAQ